MSAVTLPPVFESHLRATLTARGVNLDEPRPLARQVLALSDFYAQRPGEPTPWSEPFAASAYLSYFLPLNFARLKAVWREVERFLPTWNEVHDFGAGLGTTQWVLESEEASPRPFYAIESAKPAVRLYAELLTDWSPRWQPTFAMRTPAAGALGVFSYSFLEMQAHLPDLARFEHLLILEPSTRDCGRALMEWRARLQAMGFTPLAPCTHSEGCPLLLESPRDWCHMRIHFSAPEWFERLESFLPMKNRTLTYSYLLMSRTVKNETWRGQTRVIGDTLFEKGKTRQMICRGPKREFLSWLHKLGPAPEIPHGALVRGVEGAEVKGAELRPGPLTWTE